MLSDGSGVPVLVEYSRARCALRLESPLISPYVKTVDRSTTWAALFSESFWSSSTEMDAQHVSAMLYLAIVSYSSTHYNLVIRPEILLAATG